VPRGVSELESGEGPLGRVRRSGGDRKRAVDWDPGLRPASLALAEPGCSRRFALAVVLDDESTRQLAAELNRQGHRLSANTVAAVLREEGFSLATGPCFLRRCRNHRPACPDRQQHLLQVACGTTPLPYR
jgi:hypothetical protein